MRPQGETRELEVELNGAELIDAGEVLSDAVETADSYEEHIAERKASWRDSLKAMKEELTHLRKVASEAAEVVRTGVTKRDVACTWLYAPPAGYAFLVRDDTSELVTHRKLRDEERQLEIGEPPYREPTPEQLAEWLAALPVNEEPELAAGHAETVTAEERLVGALLDPDADESFGPSSDELSGADRARAYEQEMWEADADSDDGDEFDQDYDEGGEDTPIEEEDEDEADAALDDAIEAGVIVIPPLEEGKRPLPTPDHLFGTPGQMVQVGEPPLNPNPGLRELAAMPDAQAEALVKRSRARR